MKQSSAIFQVAYETLNHVNRCTDEYRAVDTSRWPPVTAAEHFTCRSSSACNLIWSIALIDFPGSVTFVEVDLCGFVVGGRQCRKLPVDLAIGYYPLAAWRRMPDMNNEWHQWRPCMDSRSWQLRPLFRGQTPSAFSTRTCSILPRHANRFTVYSLVLRFRNKFWRIHYSSRLFARTACARHASRIATWTSKYFYHVSHSFRIYISGHCPWQFRQHPYNDS